MHPFMDPKKMTDDQLYDKISQAKQYLGMQQNLGHQSAVDSIEAVILSLELERQDRLEHNIKEETEKQHPDMFDPINLGKIQEDTDENQQL